ncbi:MAG: hypothetical protein AVDCRST_MAG41-1073 [uncultured Corynebacteriales bacterium]|uniref:Secreted protein n=1 Tax=uncultured Mycobacteriales bacterium TaxID=581187 RepID=A0A6J4HT78_9ACTN|nr:MAG: hypothetical protein AVDCRST_MAG41-1073 [uncultured Corynebacteriales bacterium]
MRLSRIITTIAVTAGASIALAGPAMADSGEVYSVGAAAKTIFNDQNNVVSVWDRAADSHGAVGWIEVRQADGSWNRFPKVYNGNGNGTYVAQQFDIARESAQLRVVSCLQDGANGTPYSCGSAILNG